MKQEFEMTQEEMNDIISLNKNKMPVLKIGNVLTGMDLQERINSYWRGLGGKYGFKYMTVEGSSKGKLFFLAEPTPIAVIKTTTELKVDEYIENAEGHLSVEVAKSIRKIVDQLQWCGYECETGALTQNIAFIALNKLATKKE